MEHLGKILALQRRASPVLRNVSSAMLLEYANRAISSWVGVENSKLARALHFQDGTLIVGCLNSDTTQAVRLQENEIRNEINRRVGKEAVKKIRYLT